MQRLIVEIESAVKAKELQSMLSDLKFVKKVISISDAEASPDTYQEHAKVKAAIVHRKNKAIAKRIAGLPKAKPAATDKVMAHIKEGLEEGLKISRGQTKALTREEFKAQLKRD